MLTRCPACEKGSLEFFYSVDNIPVHSVRLLWSRDDALHFSTGRMDLAHCPECGFICNASFHPELQDYSAEYESTQAYSPTFNAFANRLAQDLVDRYDLHGKKILEIGCGEGEFISSLCQIGGNNGIGFDPAYDPARHVVPLPETVQIIPDYYSEKYTHIDADFVCCKMTLEHIQDVANFIGTVRRSIGDRPDTTVFFQVPDVNRVLQEVAFWDIYYEHCSYFSLGSIARVFRAQGFEVRKLWRDYGGQYLMIDALPASGPTQPSLPEENDLVTIAEDVANFRARIPAVLTGWKDTVRQAADRNERVILWGGGSKAVAFLTTLGICDEIAFAVDVNPNKNNTFLATTGQSVVSPQMLAQYPPDLVMLMNPLYRQEVQGELAKMNLAPRIVGVGE